MLPRWYSGIKSTWKSRRCGFDPWVGKIPWSGKWQPASVFLPRKFHGQRSVAGYSPWGHSQTWLSMHACIDKIFSTTWIKQARLLKRELSFQTNAQVSLTMISINIPKGWVLNFTKSWQSLVLFRTYCMPNVSTCHMSFNSINPHHSPMQKMTLLSL